MLDNLKTFSWPEDKAFSCVFKGGKEKAFCWAFFRTPVKIGVSWLLTFSSRSMDNIQISSMETLHQRLVSAEIRDYVWTSCLFHIWLTPTHSNEEGVKSFFMQHHGIFLRVVVWISDDNCHQSGNFCSIEFCNIEIWIEKQLLFFFNLSSEELFISFYSSSPSSSTSSSNNNLLEFQLEKNINYFLCTFFI